MLASITPLGEQGRRRRWGRTVTAFVIASALGGAATGLVAGALGALLVLAHGDVSWNGRITFVAALLALGLVLELLGKVPGPRRQVDESWLDRYRGWVYGAGFGFQLGAGVVTIVTSSAVYVAIGAAAATASPVAGAVLGTAVGLLRGATILAGAGLRSPDQLVRFHARMASLREPARRTGLALQAVLALAAAGVVLA
jgi:MFS family permease